MRDEDKSKEQLIAERDEERRQRQDLETAHVERQISDGRYSYKWVEKAMSWTIYTVMAAVLAGILGMVILHVNAT